MRNERTHVICVASVCVNERFASQEHHKITHQSQEQYTHVVYMCIRAQEDRTATTTLNERRIVSTDLPLGCWSHIWYTTGSRCAQTRRKPKERLRGVMLCSEEASFVSSALPCLLQVEYFQKTLHATIVYTCNPTTTTTRSVRSDLIFV